MFTARKRQKETECPTLVEFPAVKRKNFRFFGDLKFKSVQMLTRLNLEPKGIDKMSGQIEFRADKTRIPQLLHFEHILNVKTLTPETALRLQLTCHFTHLSVFFFVKLRLELSTGSWYV